MYFLLLLLEGSVTVFRKNVGSNKFLYNLGVLINVNKKSCMWKVDKEGGHYLYKKENKEENSFPLGYLMATFHLYCIRRILSKLCGHFYIRAN